MRTQRARPRDVVIMVIDGIEIELEKKNIKNMYIRVREDGSVKVTAPKRIKDEEVRKFVSSRKNWIVEHREQVLRQQQENPGKNNFTSLELWGETLPIEVVNTNGKAKIELQEGVVMMFVAGSADDDVKMKLINEWYRGILKKEVARCIPRLENLVGVKVDEWHIKNMKTKWGTCNVWDKRIWLNLQLVKKPPECLDYVIIHELTHLLERSHNAVFKGYMDQFCPDWRQLRKTLNGFGVV